MEYLIILVEGLASFISPCVLPLLPVYISYFAGQEKRSGKAVINSLGFVLGFTIIFTILGVFASTLGTLINQNMKYIKIIVGIIIILFGMHYIGIFKIKFLEKTKGINISEKKVSFLSSLILGMMFSITWTPCVGIFLSSALAMSASSDSIVKGIFMLILFSLGLGIPFIITAMFLEKLKDTFNFIKKHYEIINKISGIILILGGILIII